jgi:glycosyltransferase involved in cell wall biosynthesis
MIVSICICTHNRLDDIRECVSALEGQIDAAVAEILVIDSACDDPTRAALSEFMKGVSSGRLIRLEEPGLSLARNAAIAASSADWVAFLDDDTVPFPDYISNLVHAIGKAAPQIGFFGGRLVPRWPTGSNPVGIRWSRMLSLVDDPTERDTELGHIYGANIIYRREALGGIEGPFDPSLGRVGASLKSGEEMLLHSQLRDKGYVCRYFGNVAAEHKVAPSRLTLRWLRQRAFWEGITLVALCEKLAKPYPRGANPWWQLLKMATLSPKALFYDPDRDAYIRIWQSLGVLRARIFGTA